jgi:hypothetical protein
MPDELGLASWEMRRQFVETLIEPTQVGDLAGQSLRRVNHLLDRVEAAQEVYDLVSQFAYALERMPQALEHLEAWLGRELEAGTLLHDSGGEARLAVEVATSGMAESRRQVARAATALRRAERGLSHLYGPMMGAGL